MTQRLVANSEATKKGEELQPIQNYRISNLGTKNIDVEVINDVEANKWHRKRVQELSDAPDRSLKLFLDHH